MTTIVGPSIQKRIALAKRQVMDDIRSGLVPYHVATFSDLHDHVDANEYGDLIASWVYDGDSQEKHDAYIGVINEVQGSVDRWLRDRAMGLTPRPASAVLGDVIGAMGGECGFCGKSFFDCDDECCGEAPVETTIIGPEPCHAALIRELADLLGE